MALLTRGLGLALAGLVVAGTAGAQTEVDIGVTGGWTLPTQDAGDLYTGGYNIGGQLRWMPGSSAIGVQIDGAYHHMNREELNTQDLGLKMMSLFASAVYPVYLDASPLLPYLYGGPGVVRLEVEDPRVLDAYQTSTKFAINLGAGVEFRGWSSSFAPFLDFRLIGIFGPDPREGAYLDFNIGAKLIFGGPQRLGKKRK